MNKDYSTVRSWRDDVSSSLGSLETMSQNIEKKLDHVCNVQGKHDDRIDELERIESNRSAVQKRMTALMALIVAVVTTLSNIAWKMFR